MKGRINLGEITEFLKQNWDIILFTMCIMMILLFIIIVILYMRINKIQDRYEKLMRGTNNKKLESMILEYLDKVELTSERVETIAKEFQLFDKRITRCIQKMAIIRYQAFNDVGSDLSYSLALLDYKDNGVILTSIYGRNESTSYAKPIDKGISRYTLSEEEEEVLEKAINNYEAKYSKKS